MALPHNTPIPFPIEFIAIPQSNFTKGRNGKLPVLIVMHVADGSKPAVVNTFKNPASKVSSHFLVNKDGSVTQFVNTGDTAYANGVVVNPISEVVLARAKQNPNSYSISIEHEGFGTKDITTAQYKATAELVNFLCKKWEIPEDRSHIIGHREINADKVCPGLIQIDTIIQKVRLM